MKTEEEILIDIELKEFASFTSNERFVIYLAMQEYGKQQYELGNKSGYNQALKDFRDKLIVYSKFSEFDKKLDCWSNKNELAKSLHK